MNDIFSILKSLYSIGLRKHIDYNITFDNVASRIEVPLIPILASVISAFQY